MASSTKQTLAETDKESQTKIFPKQYPAGQTALDVPTTPDMRPGSTQGYCAQTLPHKFARALYQVKSNGS